MKVYVNKCARCGLSHDDLEFGELIKPTKDSDGNWTHWALCPTNKEPIMMKVVYKLED